MRQRRIEYGFFIVVVVLTTLAFFGLIRHFLMPLFWAVVLAVVFAPIQRWWLERTGDRGWLASILTMLTILLVVILPLALVVLALSREALALYERIVAGEIDLGAPIRLAEEWLPMVTDRLERLGLELESVREWLAGFAVAASQWIAQQALAIGQDAVRIGILFILMLYVLFFFLRDGGRMVEGVVRAVPLGDARERELFRKFAEVSRATIGGALVVAAVQGAIGGVTFWILGIPAPVFWGVIMTVLSFLPAVGASLIWIPAAVILVVTGAWVKALVLALVGLIIIGLVDNVLRPILVGRYTQMPDFLILLSTLGGLAAFGLSGVVIGPVIASFFLAVWEMFAQEHEKATATAAGPGGASVGSGRREEEGPISGARGDVPRGKADAEPTPPGR